MKYVKIKYSRMFNQFGIKKLIFETEAYYFSGHSKYIKAGGALGLTENEVVFIKGGFRAKTRWIMRIPYKRINIERMKTSTESWQEILIGTSFQRRRALITIPYLDEEGIEQTPKFEMHDMERCIQMIHNKVMKIRKGT